MVDSKSILFRTTERLTFGASGNFTMESFDHNLGYDYRSPAVYLVGNDYCSEVWK